MRKEYVYDEEDAIPIKVKRKKATPTSSPSRDRIPPMTRVALSDKSSVRKTVTSTSSGKSQPKNIYGASAAKRPVQNKPVRPRVPTAAPEKASRPERNFVSYDTRTSRRTKDRKSYRVPYIIFVAILVVISAAVLVYVHGALVDYESNQPENILAAEIDKLRSAADKGEFEKVLPLDALRSEFSATEEEIASFEKEFLESEITFKENHDTVDASQKVFDVLSDGCKVASFTLDHLSQETKLLIFTLDRWSVSSFDACGYEFIFKAPASVIIKNGDEVLSGEKDDKTSKVAYDVKTLTKPDISISDVLGNSVKYDPSNLPSFTDYKITIPSNFTIKGKETVPVSAATLTPIDSLKDVKEYCKSVPDTATYIISIMDGEPDLHIFDNNGDEVPFEFDGKKVKIDEQVGLDTLSIDVDLNPMEVAKLWSFFMTQDLGGKNNGYYQISPYLIDGSYLQGVAWKWATGIDITFTSRHTLQNPPFCTEKISNYVVYSDDCFSCDILLEKVMNLATGMQVTDTINSTFYFVNYDDTDNGVDDPHWVLVDYKEIH